MLPALLVILGLQLLLSFVSYDVASVPHTPLYPRLQAGHVEREKFRPCWRAILARGPELPEGSRDVYKRAYLQSRNGVGLLYRLTQRLEAWMHCRVAARSHPGEAVLEIGAGTLNHLPWENVGRVYDVVEPFVELFEHQPAAERLSTFFADIAEVPRERTYDRIISIATLEHVVDLPSLVAEAGLHLRTGGHFSAGIPSEGGMLWGFAWRVSVAPWFRIRTGLHYGDLMRMSTLTGHGRSSAFSDISSDRCGSGGFQRRGIIPACMHSFCAAIRTWSTAGDICYAETRSAVERPHLRRDRAGFRGVDHCLQLLCGGGRDARPASCSGSLRCSSGGRGGDGLIWSAFAPPQQIAGKHTRFT